MISLSAQSWDDSELNFREHNHSEAVGHGEDSNAPPALNMPVVDAHWPGTWPGVKPKKWVTQSARIAHQILYLIYQI